MEFSCFNLEISNSPEDILRANYWNNAAEVLNYRFEDVDFSILDSPVATPKFNCFSSGSDSFPRQNPFHLNQDGLKLGKNSFLSYPARPFIEYKDFLIPRTEDELREKGTFHDRTTAENKITWGKEGGLGKKAKVDPQTQWKDQKDHTKREAFLQNTKDEDNFKSIIRRAAVALHRQWPADAQAYKQFQTQIDERFEDLKLVSQKYLP
ncbi:hypothetical protein PGT21_024349 [Puccinia graminis f. sp. tritici]|uniref:Uncharacterized protein n=1 Tax=Puccinia graminis f. sp. tritici TaxID=56615 RepID=A0A5B0QBQ9_PUCGR|nr:hypothetical protein PGT21_024349 [Puccinia graminis f. sp. tritici]